MNCHWPEKKIYKFYFQKYILENFSRIFFQEKIWIPKTSFGSDFRRMKNFSQVSLETLEIERSVENFQFLRPLIAQKVEI